MNDLREEFYKETNIAPVFANRLPYMPYIEWLEKKLLNTEKNSSLCTCNNRNIDADDVDICGNCGENLPENYVVAK